MKRIFAAARDAVGEEPIAAGGVQALQGLVDGENDERNQSEPKRKLKTLLPPLMTPLVEEPIAMSGW